MQPKASEIVPAEAKLGTKLTRGIEMNVPLLSAAMDTVTEAPLAIAVAQIGGMGVIHRNLSIEEQAEEVRKVKRFESGMVVNPVTISPEATRAELAAVGERYNISGLPVTEKNGKLVGIVTNRDVRFSDDPNQKVRDLMTTDLVTAPVGVTQEKARALLYENRLEKLLIVDDNYRCVGLITVKDMEKASNFPNACKDASGSLRVAAASTVGDAGYERAVALIEAGVDALVIDTAHGHSSAVGKQVERIKASHPDTQIVAGNIATASAAEALIASGADALKVGIGPGSICTTRIVAGIGVPQLTAILDVCSIASDAGVPVIADGGIKYSGDMAKALAAGASSVMIGSMLAGTEEASGEVFLYQGRQYKAYRDMGSVAAMARGSADRYFQKEVSDTMKLVPEGIEGRVAYKGPVGPILHQLLGGLRAAMGYTGSETMDDFHRNAEFVRITGAGLRESHVHDVHIAREAPNYSMPG